MSNLFTKLKHLFSVKSIKLSPRMFLGSSSFKKKPIQLIIGLDFGTAFTKVVIGGLKHHPISFQGYNVGGSSYLLPSIISTSKDGKYKLGLPSDGAYYNQDLKLKIIRNELTDDDFYDICAFLALVLRHSRNWFLKEQHRIYKQYEPDWLLNLGLPTDSYHDEKLKKLYRKIAILSWSLSTIPAPLIKEQVKDIISSFEKENIFPEELDNIEQLQKIHHEKIGLFPEFVAQTAGYVRSDLKKTDLHLLIDIGAATVDITTFNVVDQKDEMKFPILSKAVTNLGTEYLIKHRVKNLNLTLPKQFSSFQNVASSRDFAKLFHLELPLLKKEDENFGDRIYKSIGEVLRHTKKHRYGKSSHWETGLPTFLCGGGSMVDLYQEVISEMKKRLEMQNMKLESYSLPTPTSLEIDDSYKFSYDRLSVAYGLSIEPLDLGRVISANDIEDEEPADDKFDPDDLFIGPEKV